MKPSDDLKTDVYKGKDAQTISEISKECGLSETTVRRLAAIMVANGKWKVVKIKTKVGFAKAYLRVK